MGNFIVGDEVVLKNGQRKMRIAELNNDIAHCVWDVDDGTQEGFYPFDEITNVTEDIP